MKQSKTPWENMKGKNSDFIKNLNKTPRRIEREKRVESLMSKDLKGKSLIISRELTGVWETAFWWAWRIGISIDIGLIMMVLYSKQIGLI